MNLSGVALGEAEINPLLKGFSFCPTQRDMKKEEILDDLEKFFRGLRLTEFFQEEEEEKETNADPLFHPLSPSSWMPPKRRDTALEMNIKKPRTDVENHLNDLQAKRCNDNIPPE